MALFLRFEGIDYEHDEDAEAKLDRYIRWVQEVLARYDGSLLQVTIGDKGSYLYAAFGAPTAHEDDLRCAVSAALDLRENPQAIPYLRPPQIGLSQGIMRAGAAGGTTRRTYGVLGDEVNLAARLMGKAALGQILASQQMARAAAHLYEFKDLGPIAIKGRREAIPVFEVLGRRRATPGKDVTGRMGARVVGRVAEQTLLAEQLQALRGGDTHAVIIQGEPGIGKSFLVERLVEQAQALEVTVLSGAADAIEQSTAYYAWRPVFRAVFGLGEMEDATLIRQHVFKQLEADATLLERAPLLNAVLPLDLPDNELTAQMAGEVRSNNTLDVLVRLLQRTVAQSPVLVILEDAHWLDSASWSLAYLVSRDVRPILLVLATRPLTEPIPEDYNFLLRLPHTRRIVLEALAPEEAMLLVCHRLGVKALPEAVAALIREKAQGNPFFSEELAYALRDAGLIEIQEGGAERTCRVAPGVGDLHALEFPDTVQGVVTSRIDRLPPAQQLTVKVASVIGRVFALRALHDVHPVEVDRPMLPAYLSTLEQWDIALLETPEPELAYIFKHVITQEVAYNLLLFVQRRQLHRAVAEWYEHSFASDLTRFYPLLAHHWLNAIETPEKDAATGKAIEYLEKAGAEALRGYANQEAIKFLTQALELDHRARTTSEPLRRAIWERQLGQAQLGLGQLPEAKAHFHRGLEILGWPMPIEPGRLVLSLLKQVARQVMHRLFPTRATPQSPDKEEDRQQQARFLEAARAYENLAEIYCFQSNTLASVYGCVATPNVAEQASTSAELARAYSNMCAAAGVVALHSLADAYRAHAQATTQRLNHTHTTAHMLARTSLFSIGMGRWEQARVDLTQAREVARRLGDRRLWGESTANLAFTEYFTGNFALSANYCEEVVAEGRRTEDPQHQSWAYYQAQHELILGHTEEAIHLLETALAQLAKQPEVNGEITSYGVLARARLRRGQLDLARQAADKGAELIAKASATAFSNIEGYAGVAETYLALWEADLNSGRAASRFGPLARRACKAFGQLGGPFPACRPRALLWRGRCEWLAGRKSPALKTWRKDLALAESLRIPYEVGLAHLELGRRLPANDPRLQRVCDRS